MALSLIERKYDYYDNDYYDDIAEIFDKNWSIKIFASCIF